MRNKMFTFVLAAAILLCSACGENNPNANTNRSETPEISGGTEQTPNPEIIPLISAGVEPGYEPDPIPEITPEVPVEAEQTPSLEKMPDLSGTYTDRLGTEDIYSRLDLTQTRDGVYSFSLSLYRTALLEGTAVYQDGAVHFTNEQPHVEGDITISGQEASIKITQSDFSELTANDVYRFPDGPAD